MDNRNNPTSEDVTDMEVIDFLSEAMIYAAGKEGIALHAATAMVDNSQHLSGMKNLPEPQRSEYRDKRINSLANKILELMNNNN
jgi:hypothetical protein